MKHLEGFPIFRFEHVSIHADKYPRWRSDTQFASPSRCLNPPGGEESFRRDVNLDFVRPGLDVSIDPQSFLSCEDESLHWMAQSEGHRTRLRSAPPDFNPPSGELQLGTHSPNSIREALTFQSSKKTPFQERSS